MAVRLETSTRPKGWKLQLHSMHLTRKVDVERLAKGSRPPYDGVTPQYVRAEPFTVFCSGIPVFTGLPGQSRFLTLSTLAPPAYMYVATSHMRRSGSTHTTE